MTFATFADSHGHLAHPPGLRAILQELVRPHRALAAAETAVDGDGFVVRGRLRPKMGDQLIEDMVTIVRELAGNAIEFQV